MPVEIMLHDSGNFMDANYFGNVSTADIQYLNDEGVRILNNSEQQKLNLVLDISQVKSHPNNVAQVWKLSSDLARHQKLGTWIVIGLDNPLTKFLIEMISKIGRVQLEVVESREEALALLATP